MISIPVELICARCGKYLAAVWEVQPDLPLRAYCAPCGTERLLSVTEAINMIGELVVLR